MSTQFRVTWLYLNKNFWFRDKNPYTYDLNQNRLSNSSGDYTINDLNQIESSPHGTLVHDLRGNIIQRGAAHYTYDIFDRLTQAGIQTFTYDGLNRRIATNDIQFIYDDKLEISASLNDQIRQKRLLGPTKQAETNATLAIFLDNEHYDPIHDLHGNIIGLTGSRQDLT